MRNLFKRKPKKHYFFVAYQFNTKDGRSGFGHTSITTTYKLETMTEIHRISNDIKESNDMFEQIVILNFIPIRGL